MPYKDPAKQREARARWRKNNREKENNARRVSRAANPEKHRDSMRLWRERNLEREREREREKDRIFRTKHKEVLREKNRQWREANPDGMILGQSRHYLSKRLGGKPPEELVEMFTLQRLIKREIRKAIK